MTKLIEHIELATGAEPKGSVIWMHGLGADCWDFVTIVKELGLPGRSAAEVRAGWSSRCAKLT